MNYLINCGDFMRILIIEDEFNLADVLRDGLEK